MVLQSCWTTKCTPQTRERNVSNFSLIKLKFNEEIFLTELFLFFFFSRVKNLKKNKKYLIGGEIEDALINATEDCPELLELINWNRRSDDEISKAYEAEKEAYDADVNDLATLENNLRKLTYVSSSFLYVYI